MAAKEKLRFTIIGAGAMGCLYGGRLALAGYPVTLIDTWQTHLDAINRRGLNLQLDGEVHNISCNAVSPDQASEVAEVAILFTKSFDSRSALNQARHLLGPATEVLTLQNGLGNVETISEFVPLTRILMGTSTWPSDMQTPGEVSSNGSGTTLVMTATGSRTESLERLVQALNEADMNCAIDPEIETAIWEKVAFNCALNIPTAILKQPLRVIADSTAGRLLSTTLVDEVLSVAITKGLKVSADNVHATVEMALHEHRDHKPSMLQDVLAGRKTEIDALNGAVVKEAIKLKIAVPVTRSLMQLIEMTENLQA